MVTHHTRQDAHEWAAQTEDFLSRRAFPCGCTHINPLVPSVLYMERLAKILISVTEGILRKKNPMSAASMSR